MPGVSGFGEVTYNSRNPIRKISPDRPRDEPRMQERNLGRSPPSTYHLAPRAWPGSAVPLAGRQCLPSPWFRLRPVFNNSRPNNEGRPPTGSAWRLLQHDIDSPASLTNCRPPVDFDGTSVALTSNVLRKSISHMRTPPTKECLSRVNHAAIGVWQP